MQQTKLSFFKFEVLDNEIFGLKSLGFPYPQFFVFHQKKKS